MFIILSTILIIIVILSITLLSIDIIKYRKGRIATNTKKQKKINMGFTVQANKFSASYGYELILSFLIWYKKEFGLDTGKWIARKILLEIIEIILQSQALLLYNGSYIFNRNTVYLAYDSEYIILFSCILLLNCTFCGILWLFYAFKPKVCHGLLFQLILCFIDVIFDLFYALFPLIVVISNDEDSNILVSLASLQTGNTLSYILF